MKKQFNWISEKPWETRVLQGLVVIMGGCVVLTILVAIFNFRITTMDRLPFLKDALFDYVGIELAEKTTVRTMSQEEFETYHNKLHGMSEEHYDSE